jgi:hypothetical protein
MCRHIHPRPATGGFPANPRHRRQGRADFGGTAIRLRDKGNVLHQEEHEDANCELAPFVRVPLEFELR